MDQDQGSEFNDSAKIWIESGISTKKEIFKQQIK